MKNLILIGVLICVLFCGCSGSNGGKNPYSPIITAFIGSPILEIYGYGFSITQMFEKQQSEEIEIIIRNVKTKIEIFKATYDKYGNGTFGTFAENITIIYDKTQDYEVKIKIGVIESDWQAFTKK